MDTLLNPISAEVCKLPKLSVSDMTTDKKGNTPEKLDHNHSR